MRIITAITPDHMEVLRHTLPVNMQHYPVEVHEATEAYPDNGAESVRGRIPCKPMILYQADGPMLWMDADAWIIRPFDALDVLRDCDIAVTMRRQVERGVTERPDVYGYLNTGVVFVNETDAASEFLDAWISEVEMVDSRSDQHAINNLVLGVADLGQYDKVFKSQDGVRIKILSTDEYNWSYWPEEPGPNTKILHMKNNQRKQYDLAEWTKRRFI